MGTGLMGLSNEMADAVASAAPAVVQVQGGRRPASGVVHSNGVVLTTARALGRGDGLHVRRGDGATFEAELAGWDPTTSLAVLNVEGLDVPPVVVAEVASAGGPSGPGGGTVVEQRRDGERGHRCRHRRATANRPQAVHRPGDQDDGADA